MDLLPEVLREKIFEYAFGPLGFSKHKNLFKPVILQIKDLNKKHLQLYNKCRSCRYSCINIPQCLQCYIVRKYSSVYKTMITCNTDKMVTNNFKIMSNKCLKEKISIN